MEDNLPIKRYSKLLLPESPLVVLPSLAKELGATAALLLQQIHYWISNPMNKNIHNNRVWVYKTYDQWMEEISWVSYSTIKRSVNELEKRGLIITGCFNKFVRDRTKWYTIDYDKLEEIESLVIGTIAQNGLLQQLKLSSSNSSKRADVYRTETTTETTTDIKTNNGVLSDSNNTEKVSSLDDKFEQFWDLFPNKGGKKDARKVFNNLLVKKPELFDKIILAVQNQNVVRDKIKTAGGFVPNPKLPAGWLRSERWEDAIEVLDERNIESVAKRSTASENMERELNIIKEFREKRNAENRGRTTTH